MKEKTQDDLEFDQSLKELKEETKILLHSPKKIIGFIIFLVICAVGYNMYTAHTEAVAKNEQLVLGIQTATTDRYPDMSFKEAFDEYFDTQEWTSDTTDAGVRFVEFNGTVEPNTSVCIQWEPTEDDAYFDMNYFSVNEEPQDDNTINAVLDEVFIYAYNAKGYDLPYREEDYYNSAPTYNNYNNAYDNLNALIDGALAPAYDELNRQMNELTE